MTSWQRPKQICRQIHLTRCHILGGRPEGSAGAAHGSGASTGSGRGGAGKMADGSMCRSRGTFLWVGGGRLSTGASHGSPMWRIFSHGGPSRSRSQSQSQSQSLRHRHEVTCICRYLYIYMYMYICYMCIYASIYMHLYIYKICRSEISAPLATSKSLDFIALELLRATFGIPFANQHVFELNCFRLLGLPSGPSLPTSKSFDFIALGPLALSGPPLPTSNSLDFIALGQLGLPSGLPLPTSKSLDFIVMQSLLCNHCCAIVATQSLLCNHCYAMFDMQHLLCNHCCANHRRPLCQPEVSLGKSCIAKAFYTAEVRTLLGKA